MPMVTMAIGFMVIVCVSMLIVVFMYRSRRLAWTISGRIFRAASVILLTMLTLYILYRWIIDWNFIFSYHRFGPLGALDEILFTALDDGWVEWNSAPMALRTAAAFMFGLFGSYLALIPFAAVIRGVAALVRRSA